MKVIFKSKIKGCFLLEHNNFKDERGNFAKVFSDQFTKKYLNKKRIKQINYSTTKKVLNKGFTLSNRIVNLN